MPTSRESLSTRGPCFGRAVEWRTQTLTAATATAAHPQPNLGLLLQAQGDFSTARRHIEDALSICQQQLSRDHLSDVARA